MIRPSCATQGCDYDTVGTGMSLSGNADYGTVLSLVSFPLHVLLVH